MVVLQAGISGGLNLVILLILAVLFLVVPPILGAWVYRDASRRGDENALLWAVAVAALTFFTFFGGLLALVVYRRERD